MCVDIFAPGFPVTIDFLHERIYFSTSHNSLTAVECCDVFIRNDNPRQTIGRLRIQFPHFVDWLPFRPEAVEILPVPIANTERQWYGSYHAQDGDVFEHDPEDGTKRRQGLALSGNFEQPTGTGNAEEFLGGMRSLQAMVLDLHLNTPIPSGMIGWFRLAVKPSNWPGDEAFSLNRPCSVGGTHEFMARLKVSSPGMLRDDLHINIQKRRPDWIGTLVNDGWRRPYTQTRVMDHRITLIFARDVQISHLITFTFPKPILTVEPFTIDTQEFSVKDGLARFAQTFLTGSDKNKECDVVGMADRIRDYILTVNSGSQPKPVSKPELVTRFGGLNHEAVGTLIKEMIECGLLVRKGAEAHEDLYLPEIRRDQWRTAMTTLRAKYTFLGHLPEKIRPFYAEFRDMHPFHISFTMRWSAHTDEQIRKSERLASLVHTQDPIFDFSKHALRPSPRRAVIVSCGECADKKLATFPFLKGLGEELAGILRSIGQFEVTLVSDPDREDQILNPITESLNALPNDGKGLFLFWFLGHGIEVQTRRDGLPELHLCHLTSMKHGLRWTTVLQRLTNLKVPKILVLDCCYAGLAAIESLPHKTLLWTVTRSMDTTPVVDADNRSIGFTQAARDLFLSGISGGASERQPITFSRLLSAAQERFGRTTDHPQGKREGDVAEEQLEAALNMIRYDVLPVMLLEQLQRQIIAGIRV